MSSHTNFTVQPNAHMHNHLARLASYKDWPQEAPAIFSSYLVDVGFYYDAGRRSVICFVCGLCVKVSELEDHASKHSLLEMHLQCSRNCTFALQKRIEYQPDVTTFSDGQTNNVSVPTNNYLPTSASENNVSESSNGITSGCSQTTYQNPTPAYSEAIGARQTSSSYGFNTPPQLALPDTASMPARSTIDCTDRQHSNMCGKFATNMVRIPTVEEYPSLARSAQVATQVASQQQDLVDHSWNIQEPSSGDLIRHLNSVTLNGSGRIYDYDLKHPQYKEEESRRISFRVPNTPHILLVKIEEIVNAGFFFTGEFLPSSFSRYQEALCISSIFHCYQFCYICRDTCYFLITLIK